MTPVLTPHARERAAQMGIPTKRVKRMLATGDYVRFADCVHYGGRWHARGRDFTAVVVGEGDALTVVTLLFNEPFTRPAG